MFAHTPRPGPCIWSLLLKCKHGRKESPPYVRKKSLSDSPPVQRYRLGPNFRFVEVNRPRCPLHNNAQDGPLNIANQTGEINYYPSEFSNQVGLHAARCPCTNCAQGMQSAFQLYRHQQCALSASDIINAGDAL